jgi:hypothetical protein
MSERVLICGSRDLAHIHFEYIVDCIKRIQRYYSIECIIQGGARGADYLGKQAAIKLNIPWEETEFKAEWDLFGKAAGHIRNTKMITEGKPTICLAFVNKPLEESRGTHNCVTQCKNVPIKCFVFMLD